MDALVNYGSDDESSDKYLENKSSRTEDMKISGRSLSDTVEDVNYDNVQMDMSEESDAGQRPKAGEAGRSSSSCPSSSSEGEDEPLHVKPRASTGLGSHDTKRGAREKDAGSGRHRRREEGRRSPGQKDRHSRRKDRVGRRSRSKDRSEKSKESKEKERERKRRESSREKGGPYDGESKEGHRSSREGSCRSRSRDRARYRHHSERRRSRSRSPHHHHRHHHRHREDGERRSKRSRGRSSSRNHSGDECRSAEAKKASAVSRAVAAAAANIAAAVAATEAALKNESNSELEEDSNYTSSTKGSQQALMEGLGLQGEGGSTPKAAVGGLAASLMSPQLLVQRSLEVQASHVHNTTGIQFPAYYNPAAMNPLKYAEQMQKRKKLWGGNKDVSKESSTTGSSGSTNNWESTTFAQDQDGKLSAKFKRLMGIKTAGATVTPSSTQPEGSGQPSEDVIKKQEELFSTMERQYEAARLATHTLRGVGLGFGSSSAYQYPR